MLERECRSRRGRAGGAGPGVARLSTGGCAAARVRSRSGDAARHGTTTGGQEPRADDAAAAGAPRLGPTARGRRRPPARRPVAEGRLRHLPARGRHTRPGGFRRTDPRAGPGGRRGTSTARSRGVLPRQRGTAVGASAAADTRPRACDAPQQGQCAQRRRHRPAYRASRRRRRALGRRCPGHEPRADAARLRRDAGTRRRPRRRGRRARRGRRSRGRRPPCARRAPRAPRGQDAGRGGLRRSGRRVAVRDRQQVRRAA